MNQRRVGVMFKTPPTATTIVPTATRHRRADDVRWREVVLCAEQRLAAERDQDGDGAVIDSRYAPASRPA